MDTTAIEAMRARIGKAHSIVHELCDGTRRWTMSIPAREDYDPDLVISAALRDADDLLDQNAELQRQLEEARSKVWKEAIAVVWASELPPEQEQWTRSAIVDALEAASKEEA